ncbi:MAG: hypothetical protein H6667_08000 [Ardenticatenaceae bacterium]|nr:hypothetical protein [Ardenticatenaceae bacterium]MCB9444662.1 hypothetical protein [Ardenticatenaceae bacterium]
MSSLFKQLRSRIIGHQETSLDDIQRLAPNMTRQPATANRPEHLVRHGVIDFRGQRQPFNMTIHKRGANIESTSIMGEIPNNSFGSISTETINQAMDGKYVRVNSNKPETSRLALVTQQPANQFNEKTFKREQDRHVTAYSEVSPILRRVSEVNKEVTTKNFQEQTNIARQIVSRELGTQQTLKGQLRKPRYFPQIFSEED